jgi:hypothetical protein
VDYDQQEFCCNALSEMEFKVTTKKILYINEATSSPPGVDLHPCLWQQESESPHFLHTLLSDLTSTFQATE